jgi:hypothetical protein
VYKEIDERLARSRLNTTNKRLVYRPTRARELASRKNPIIIDGKKLEPLIWKGRPSIVVLTQCIDLMKSQEEYVKVKRFIREYADYYPKRVKPYQLSVFLRQGTSIGLFSECVTFLHSETLKPYLNESIVKEILRIYAIKLSQVGQAESERYLTKFNKVITSIGSDDIDVNLLALAGLSNLATMVTDQGKNVVMDQLKERVNRAETLLSGYSPLPFDRKNKPGFIASYINIQLCLQGIAKAKELGINVDNLQTVLEPAVAKMKKYIRSPELYTEFMKKIHNGLAKDYEFPDQTQEIPEPKAEAS